MLTSDEAVQSPKNICLVNLTTFLDMVGLWSGKLNIGQEK